MVRLFQVDCGDPRPIQCAAPPELAIGAGDACVVDADKILEFGRVLTALAPAPSTDGWPLILRRATLQDQSKASENLLFGKSAARLCAAKVADLKLGMRLIRVRYTFDRVRLVVSFTSDDRVDFRQLVQQLSAETRVRVEMRQIGVRDAAGIMGGLAPCGRVLCCAAWLGEFENVHIRMAKTQGLSLNPAAINGMCGRLKCCLRFEDHCYRDLHRALPRQGERVTCAGGCGKVLATHPLRQRVKVLLEDASVQEFDARDIKMLGSVPPTRDNAPP